MKKTTVQLSAIGVLGLVLVVMLFNNVVKPALKRPVSAPAPIAALPGAASPNAAPAAAVVRKNYEEMEWARNPFLRVGAPAPIAPAAPKVVPTFVLEGIVWDPAMPYAIINGELRGVGDRIDDFEVVEITQKRVTMKRDDQVIDLGLFPELGGK